MKRILVLASVALAACGGDGGTGPSLPSVAGTWTLSQSNLAGSGVSCNVLGTSTTLVQNGGTFTGNYGGGTISCVGPGGSFSDNVGSGSIVNGTVNANGAVSMDLDTQDWHLTGNLSGNSMSGTATIRLNVSSGTVTLVGNWSAAKQ